MSARRRLRTTLVYFGVVTDPVEEARLGTAPMNGWRLLAIVIAFAVAGAAFATIFALIALLAGETAALAFTVALIIVTAVVRRSRW